MPAPPSRSVSFWQSWALTGLVACSPVSVGATLLSWEILWKGGMPYSASSSRLYVPGWLCYHGLRGTAGTSAGWHNLILAACHCGGNWSTGVRPPCLQSCSGIQHCALTHIPLAAPPVPVPSYPSSGSGSSSSSSSASHLASPPVSMIWVASILHEEGRALLTDAQ